MSNKTVPPPKAGESMLYNIEAEAVRRAEVEKQAARYRLLRKHAEVFIVLPYVSPNFFTPGDSDEEWDNNIDDAIERVANRHTTKEQT